MAFQAVDPAGYATQLSDIVNILASHPTFGQNADGSFNGWVQSEAYVIMGLVAVDEIEMAYEAAEWLIENQGYDTIAGGWKLPNGKEYSEVTSEAGQAIFCVLNALPVGGVWAPTNALELLAPWVAVGLIVLGVATAGIRRFAFKRP